GELPQGVVEGGVRLGVEEDEADFGDSGDVAGSGAWVTVAVTNGFKFCTDRTQRDAGGVRERPAVDACGDRREGDRGGAQLAGDAQ
ncbi:hypothetical protein ADK38_00960, partial [Streptomyces varsoviensis]